MLALVILDHHAAFFQLRIESATEIEYNLLHTASNFTVSKSNLLTLRHLDLFYLLFFSFFCLFSFLISSLFFSFLISCPLLLSFSHLFFLPLSVAETSDFMRRSREGRDSIAGSTGSRLLLTRLKVFADNADGTNGFDNSDSEWSSQQGLRLTHGNGENLVEKNVFGYISRISNVALTGFDLTVLSDNTDCDPCGDRISIQVVYDALRSERSDSGQQHGALHREQEQNSKVLCPEEMSDAALCSLTHLAKQLSRSEAQQKR